MTALIIVNLWLLDFGYISCLITMLLLAYAYNCMNYC